MLILALFLSPVQVRAQQVRISGFTNISLGPWNGSGDLTAENNLCIYNSATADYRVRARGSGAGNAFHLSGVGGDVDYGVRFKQSTGSYVTLTADVFQDFTDANTSSDNCGGLTNASLEVSVSSDDLSAAAAGSYSGTLTVLLETR